MKLTTGSAKYSSLFCESD